MQQYTPTPLSKATGNKQMSSQKQLLPSFETSSQKASNDDPALRYGHLEAIPMIYRCGQPVPLPITLAGHDGATYILDQLRDNSTGVFSVCVYKKNGPYNYQQVFKGDAFRSKVDNPQGASNLLVDHYIGQ
jgi:hypothetical protein